MTTSSSARVGTVLSADVAVPDHERVVHFYARVLTTGDDPLWREDLMNSEGTPIIGVGKRVPEYADLPLQWMPHIQVADVATSAGRAVELGGRELMHGRDAEGLSQWAVLTDPDGAAFGLIPVVSEDAPASGEDAVASGSGRDVGRIAWFDLAVPDAAAARDFYRQVVGWSVTDVELEDDEGAYADYTLVAADGSEVGGICHARGASAALPPVWLIYLPVGDLAESLRQAAEGGGAVVHTQKRKDGEVVYAVVRDPVGTHFAVAPG